ncbi:MAG: cation:proton antiporter, partial [Clostridia bacterium]
MAEMFSSLTHAAGVLLAVAILWLSGFLMTRVTKIFKLPNVTGYLLAGMVIGPYVLHLIPNEIIAGMDFVTDIALSFIAFGVGKY